MACGTYDVPFEKEPKKCLPCGGTGVQVLKDGLRIPCPFCQKTTDIKWRS